jgi:hypothetical protein
MTAYVMAGSGSFRDIGNASIWGVATARTGGDTIDLNGNTLLIDQDCRYGLSGTTSTTLGNLTVNAAKGGEIHIDGTKVWMIPFTGGSGTLTLGTQITIGGVTCNTIGIYTALTAAPATTGASGWLKVTNASGTPGAISSGTYAGFTLTANGAARRGFIEVNGDEASTVYANRLGTFRVTGEWFRLGTTSGTSNQTLQVPNNGAARYCPGVFIEKSVGSGTYEFYPNNGTNTATGTDATRGKVVWVDATGLVRIGNSGAATNGYTPVAGLKVVVPNIFFENNTTAARTANVIPNAAIATRYDFTTTGGGVVVIDKACMNWYLSISQAYSCNVSNSCFTDAILLAEVAAPMTFTSVGVGNKPTTALLASPLTMSLCFAGGTFTDCVWQRVSMAASAAHTVTLSDIDGFTFTNNTIRAGVIRANATTFSVNATRVNNCTWDTPVVIQGAMTFTTCNNITVNNTVYCESVSATTVTTYAGSVWTVASNTLNFTASGLSMPVTNTQPYTALLQINAAGCSNIKLRNIGTRAVPVTAGSTNGCGLVYALAAGAAATKVKVQRVYVSNTRTGVMTGDNSSKGVIEENVYGDYADAADVAAVLEYQRKARGTSMAYTAQTAVYGTHWADHFTSATAGRLALVMNEPTANTTSQVSLTNGAAFTAAGALYMPVIGHSATFELPYYALGHTLFTDTAGVMAGGIATNYNYNFAVDKNDGAGWSAMTTANYTATTLGTALNALGALDPAKGVKLRLKITTITTNTTAITSFYVTTTSTAAAQDNQYPLDTAGVSVAGLVTGSRVKAYKVSDGTVLFNGAESSGAVSFTTDYVGAVVIDARKGSNAPYYQPWVTQVVTVSNATVSATALQQLDE